MMFPAGSFLLVRAYFYDSVIQEKCLFDWAAAFRIWLASGCCSSMTMAIYGRWVRSYGFQIALEAQYSLLQTHPKQARMFFLFILTCTTRRSS